MNDTSNTVRMRKSQNQHDVQSYDSTILIEQCKVMRCATTKEVTTSSIRHCAITTFFSIIFVLARSNNNIDAFHRPSICIRRKVIINKESIRLTPYKLFQSLTTSDNIKLDGDHRHDKDSKSTIEQKTGKNSLSRPERKAFERARKESSGQGSKQGSITNTTQQQQQRRSSISSQKRRKHNFLQRQEHLLNQTVSQRYELHSTVIPVLSTNSSTPNDLMRAIKRAQNLHDVHDLQSTMRFLVEQTDTSFAYGYRGSLLARLSVAAMHLNQLDLANEAFKLRRTEHFETILPLESAAIIRGLLRVHDVPTALKILDEELPLPTRDEVIAIIESTDGSHPKNIVLKDIIRHRSLSLTSIASRHFFEDEPIMALDACNKLLPLGSLVRIADIDDLSMPWSRLLQGAAQCQSRLRGGTVSTDNNNNENIKLPCNLVYSVLNSMAAFPSVNDDRVYEIIANSLVRRVVFVGGAINMEGLPKADRGEAAFIGRSNVGKSSLVNMVTNRKSLAYTSKRPGKTQQINFFAVNDKVGREKEIRYGDVLPGHKDDDSFYIVDLPGFGYAKVPEQQRKQWLNFMHEYLSQRTTLRVVFHLIDSRLGPTDDDATTMKEVRDYLPKNVAYIIVLTKADKNVKGAATQYYRGKVSTNIMNNLRQVKDKNGLANAPVILSSSETKLGRDEIWKYLRLAAET